MNQPTPPALSLSASELPRSTLELGKLAFQFKNLLKQAPLGDGHPVLVLPGYGGADSSMLALRVFLNKLNYTAFRLKLGRNFESADERIMRIEDAVRFREKMTALVVSRLEEIHAKTNQAVTLIGWSMGGLYALDASQLKPEMCKQVITLGSPFGDPRGTAAFNLMRRINRSKVPIEDQNFELWNKKMSLQSNKVPIKVIHSHKDGIVGCNIQKLNKHQSVEYFNIDSSHIGFAANPKTFQLISDIL